MHTRVSVTRLLSAAIFVGAVIAPAFTAAAWAAGSQTPSAFDDLSCHETFGCPGGAANCAEFETVSGGFTWRVHCKGPLNAS
jgi:hypothetical protein